MRITCAVILRLQLSMLSCSLYPTYLSDSDPDLFFAFNHKQTGTNNPVTYSDLEPLFQVVMIVTLCVCVPLPCLLVSVAVTVFLPERETLTAHLSPEPEPVSPEPLQRQTLGDCRKQVPDRITYQPERRNFNKQ